MMKRLLGFECLFLVLVLSCLGEQAEKLGPTIVLKMEPRVTIDVASPRYSIFTEDPGVTYIDGEFNAPESLVIIRDEKEGGCLYILFLNERRFSQLEEKMDHIISATPAREVELGPLSCGMTLVKWMISGNSI